MARRRVDNFVLERWRSLDAVVVLRAFADYLKQDTEFMPRQSHDSTRCTQASAASTTSSCARAPSFSILMLTGAEAVPSIC